MTPALNTLKAELHEHIASCVQLDRECTVYVALSGGLDSMTLLHLLCAYRTEHPHIKLCAIHINHGISPFASEWETFCKTQCEQRKVTFSCERVRISKHKQKSLEAEARNARYRLIDAHVNTMHSNNNFAVCLGQHQNDQAETFLLQLQRGAGVKGLSCMPKQRINSNNVTYLRPFLRFTRGQLQVYAENEGIRWIEDESNTDENYDRNFLRHSVMPILQEKWPHISATIARSAQHCADAQAVIDEYMVSLQEKLLLTDLQLNIEALQRYPSATQRSFLRFWLSKSLALAPSQAQLDDIIRLLSYSQNKTPYVILKNMAIERFQGALHLVKLRDMQNVSIDLRLEMDTTFARHWHLRHLDTSQSVHTPQSIEMPKAEVQVVFGGSNLKAKLFANRPQKALKYWYQEQGVSPLQRKQCPVLVYNNQVIAVLLSNQLIIATPSQSAGSLHTFEAHNKASHNGALVWHNLSFSIPTGEAALSLYAAYDDKPLN